ncbi:isochorismatase [Bacillus canaveralius]|uniref:Isochorismatase n=1 Tax=Bacillus canaveralius TaxID=1403243 RepID=A0A2N5GHD1_9BACI|nr:MULTISPECIES: isochorismatase family cysteine hydrolase [Bacillus]PLR80198.1 isochorismatase [Bacillus canaveralius]PLR81953.1 isochorismatase [Bacillus sp. V33-4]PLR88139.1 isochorismatase [Bacillus canaveralius]RSK46897.1 cysteine hydrolase [Bacillus canaveralius]
MNVQNDKKTALLIIDMINDFQFDYGETLANKTLSILKPILSLREKFHHEQMPVIYINDHYDLWQADIYKIAAYCKNETSAPIIEKMLPGENDYFLIKPKHSAFYGTALNTLLKKLKVDKLIITGIAGNICVLFTANDAYMREYELAVPNNCLVSNSDQENDYALMMMKNVLKADTNPIHL